MAQLVFPVITKTLCKDKCGHCAVILPNAEINKLHLKTFLEIIQNLISRVQNPKLVTIDDSFLAKNCILRGTIEVIDVLSIVIVCNGNMKFQCRIIQYNNNHDTTSISNIKHSMLIEIMMYLQLYVLNNYCTTRDTRIKEILKTFMREDLTQLDHQNILYITQLIHQVLAALRH